jgi:carbon-monoxide dehydrogenase iron sulfur subunit
MIPHNCTGCRTCELACSFAHSTGGVMARSRIRIHAQGDERFIQVNCLQCVEAACAKVCPVEALQRNPDTGAIEVQAGRCVGCGLCEVACPFGHMHFDRQLKLPIKCDLCGGRPACAAFCPHNALEAR